MTPEERATALAAATATSDAAWEAYGAASDDAPVEERRALRAASAAADAALEALERRALREETA